MPGKSSSSSGSDGKRGRSAVTGRFVKQSTVRRHPSTTVNERAARRRTSRRASGPAFRISRPAAAGRRKEG
ncbi:hypothetical protein Sipo7851_40815 [Streptomyces ipomoeae]|nr:hypothetical protein Sipo7851_40815 [Streptomyces ipomoeae]